jgi:hypothetical protein
MLARFPADAEQLPAGVLGHKPAVRARGLTSVTAIAMTARAGSWPPSSTWAAYSPRISSSHPGEKVKITGLS